MKLIIGGFCQGKTEYAKTAYPENEIMNSFHLYVKEQLKCGKTKDEILDAVDKKIKNNPELIIISDEIGNGVVPMDKEDRLYREATGRILTSLAQKAESVERVVCGIAVRIK